MTEPLNHPSTDEVFDRLKHNTAPTTTRLTDRVLPWFAESFEKHAHGEPIVWDVSMLAMPDPNARPAPGEPMAFIGVLMLYSEIPGAVLGTCITMTSMLQPNSLTPEMVDNFVTQLVEQLVRGRSQQLDAMNSQQEAAQKNGQPAPTRGLVIPGM